MISVGFSMQVSHNLSGDLFLTLGHQTGWCVSFRLLIARRYCRNSLQCENKNSSRMSGQVFLLLSVFTMRNVKVFLGCRTLHNILATSTETFGNILKTKGTDMLETWPKRMCQGHLFALWELKWVVRILLCFALAGETSRMWAESLPLHRCEDHIELRITSQYKWGSMVSRNSEDPPHSKNSLQHCCSLYL